MKVVDILQTLKNVIFSGIPPHQLYYSPPDPQAVAAHSPSTAALHKYHHDTNGGQDTFSDFVGILCQDGQNHHLAGSAAAAAASSHNPRSPKVSSYYTPPSMYPPPPTMSRPVPLVRSAADPSSPPVSSSPSEHHHVSNNNTSGTGGAGYDMMPPILPTSDHTDGKFFVVVVSEARL